MKCWEENSNFRRENGEKIASFINFHSSLHVAVEVTRGMHGNKKFIENSEEKS
jgi:hypothetical protein